MTGKINLGASVAARLLQRAKATGADYQTVLTSFCLVSCPINIRNFDGAYPGKAG